MYVRIYSNLYANGFRHNAACDSQSDVRSYQPFNQFSFIDDRNGLAAFMLGEMSEVNCPGGRNVLFSKSKGLFLCFLFFFFLFFFPLHLIYKAPVGKFFDMR